MPRQSDSDRPPTGAELRAMLRRADARPFIRACKTVEAKLLAITMRRERNDPRADPKR
jgi:hypothetical protein